jgi:hypothetical protein
MSKSGVDFLMDMITGRDEERRKDGVRQLLRLSGHTLPNEEPNVSDRDRAVREAAKRAGK